MNAVARRTRQVPDGEDETALVRRRPEERLVGERTSLWAGLGVGLGAAALAVGVIALILLFRRSGQLSGALAAPPPCPQLPAPPSSSPRRLLEEGYV